MSDRLFVREISGQYGLKEEKKRLWSATRVISGDNIPFTGGPQMWHKKLIDPADGLTQTLHVHIEVLAPGGKSQKHGHQNEAMLYILDGHGWEIHDGIRHDWRAGDVAVVSNGCVHQHFNGSSQDPCKILIMKTKPLYLFLNLMHQASVESAPKHPVEGFENWVPDDEFRAEITEGMEWFKGSQECSWFANPYQPMRDLLPPYNQQRKIVHPQDMPWENCAQGKLKHLVNENMDARIRGHDAYMQIIPAGSRSGKHRHMWEEVAYVVEGEGYDLHWDAQAVIQDEYHWTFEEVPKRLDWKSNDLIYVPPNTIHQHFNTSAEKTARLIVASARIYRWLGFTEVVQFEEASTTAGRVDR